MDFAKRDILAVAEKGFDFIWTDPIPDLSPDAEKEPDVVISLLGAGSRVHKQAAARLDAYHAQCQRTGKPADAEHIKQLITELTAKCTTGWKNVAVDGKDVPFSYENAVDMYTKYPILREPVFEAIHNVIVQLEKK